MLAKARERNDSIKITITLINFAHSVECAILDNIKIFMRECSYFLRSSLAHPWDSKAFSMAATFPMAGKK